MIEPISASDYCKRIEERAEEAFLTHQLSFAQEDRWIIRKQDNNMHWAEIVAMRGGGLVVWGDIELVCFAYGPRDREAIFWIAKSLLSYAREKAAIGSSYDMTEFVPEVAIHELEVMRSHQDALSASEQDRKLIEEIGYAIDDLKNGRDQHELLVELQDAGVDSEELSSLGRVPAVRVFYARAAVKRLAKLLEEERP